MGKKKKTLVQVEIDIPDEKWADLLKMTGQTDPDKVVEIVLRDFLRHHRETHNA